jgi:hypothetical protein
MPITWTSLAGVDPFVEVAAGRAMFRPEDLLRLAAFVVARCTSDSEDAS